MPISHVFNILCPGSSGVEQRTENPRVGSSNLPPGTTLTKSPTLASNNVVYVGLFV